jgi:tetratricopeptide (TPR) repeat protein
VVLGEALVEAGMRERGLEELDIALGLYEAAEKWKEVARLVAEVLRIEPDSVRHHQKRVEGAFRTGEKRDLVEAYLGLGNALLRSGSSERSAMVFRRVLEYEPDNETALAAIASLTPKEAAEPPPEPAPAAVRGDYVDLGALIFDDDTSRDTRMRVEDEEPTGDEEKDFADMLAQFKRGIEANIEDEDWQAHYDLGVAFKEMGLVDEAIAEFQKALRSPPGRLRTAEALGGCFFDKRQFSVAATVMRRAVDTDPAGDEAKIALLYWLGRCDEEMGRTSDALAWFQRVFALDIRFADVADRVERLAAAGH